MYLLAAIAYLDTGAFDRAEQMLTSAPQNAAAPLRRDRLPAAVPLRCFRELPLPR